MNRFIVLQKIKKLYEKNYDEVSKDNNWLKLKENKYIVDLNNGKGTIISCPFGETRGEILLIKKTCTKAVEPHSSQEMSVALSKFKFI